MIEAVSRPSAYDNISVIENAAEFGHHVEMKTALELLDSTLDESERQFVNVIREHGWFHTRVFDDKDRVPDFSYTSGFSVNHSYPEIILFRYREKYQAPYYGTFGEISKQASGRRLEKRYVAFSATLMQSCFRSRSQHIANTSAGTGGSMAVTILSACNSSGRIETGGSLGKVISTTNSQIANPT